MIADDEVNNELPKAQAEEPPDLSKLLDEIFDLRRAPAEFIDRIDPLFARGRPVDEYYAEIKEYCTERHCGLAWPSCYLAYRCRTCSNAPTMSLCADCFRNGNHEGHDYNMFKSRSGGACDCGYPIVRDFGHCKNHGQNGMAKRHGQPIPQDLLSVPGYSMPRIIHRLLIELRRGKRDALHDIDAYVDFLNSVSSRGELMRNLMIDTFTDKRIYSSQIHRMCNHQDQKIAALARERMEIYANLAKNLLPFKPRPSWNCPAPLSRIEAFNDTQEQTCFIEELIFWSAIYEFPQKLICFLLGFLMEPRYRRIFSKSFVNHYPRMIMLLTRNSSILFADSPFQRSKDAFDQLSRRVLQVSVQLYNDEPLTTMLCQENYALHVLIYCLKAVIEGAPPLRGILTPNSLGPADRHTAPPVVIVEDPIIKDKHLNSYTEDFNALLPFYFVANQLIMDDDLRRAWIDLVATFQTMNPNKRELNEHTQYESNIYSTIFTTEADYCLTPVWSILSHLKDTKTAILTHKLCLNLVDSLKLWLGALGVETETKPNPYLVSFHLPLHRIFAAVYRNAVFRQQLHPMNFMHRTAQDPIFLVTGEHNENFAAGALTISLPLEDDTSFYRKLMSHPLQAVILYHEVRCSLWSRNGVPITSQAMTYVHFAYCYSTIDLDMFLLRLCASNIEPNCFMRTVADRFHVWRWFSIKCMSVHQFRPANNFHISPEQVIPMLESMLVFLVQLVTLHMDVESNSVGEQESEKHQTRREMVSLMSVTDGTHSFLVDSLPGQTGLLATNADETNLEHLLAELANYKPPTLDTIGGSLQQGTYSLKPHVWDSEYDPLHVQYRAFHRRDYQVSLERFFQHCKQTGKIDRSCSSTKLWPPFRIPTTLGKNKCVTLRPILKSKVLMGIVYSILYKALFMTAFSNDVTDSVLSYAIYLLELACRAQHDEMVNEQNETNLRAQSQRKAMDVDPGVNTEKIEDPEEEWVRSTNHPLVVPACLRTCMETAQRVVHGTSENLNTSIAEGVTSLGHRLHAVMLKDNVAPRVDTACQINSNCRVIAPISEDQNDFLYSYVDSASDLNFESWFHHDNVFDNMSVVVGHVRVSSKSRRPSNVGTLLHDFNDIFDQRPNRSSESDLMPSSACSRVILDRFLRSRRVCASSSNRNVQSTTANTGRNAVTNIDQMARVTNRGAASPLSHHVVPYEPQLETDRETLQTTVQRVLDEIDDYYEAPDEQDFNESSPIFSESDTDSDDDGDDDDDDDGGGNDEHDGTDDDDNNHEINETESNNAIVVRRREQFQRSVNTFDDNDGEDIEMDDYEEDEDDDSYLSYFGSDYSADYDDDDITEYRNLVRELTLSANSAAVDSSLTSNTPLQQPIAAIEAAPSNDVAAGPSTSGTNEPETPSASALVPAYNSSRSGRAPLAHPELKIAVTGNNRNRRHRESKVADDKRKSRKHHPGRRHTYHSYYPSGESVVTLLLRLHAQFEQKPRSYCYDNQRASAPRSRIGTGVHFITMVLDLWCRSQPDGEARIEHLKNLIWATPRKPAMNSETSPIGESTRMSSANHRQQTTREATKTEPTSAEERRRRAKEHQKKLMADFAAKQKAFLNKIDAQPEDAPSSSSSEFKTAPNEKKVPGASSSTEKTASKGVCGETVGRKHYECWICCAEGESTIENQFGQVVLLQTTSVLSHAHLRSPKERRLPCGEHELDLLRSQTYGKYSYRRLELLCENFSDESWIDSINIGIVGGVLVQTCGHYLHLKCHQEYMKTLQANDSEQRRSRGLSFDGLSDDRPDFACPVCRQMANSVLPILPAVPCHSSTNIASSTQPHDDGQTLTGKGIQVRYDARQFVNYCISIADDLKPDQHDVPPPDELRESQAFCSDLTRATWPQYRSVRTTPTVHSLNLFLASIARTNLECEVVVRLIDPSADLWDYVAPTNSDGVRDEQQPSTSYGKTPEHSRAYTSNATKVSGRRSPACFLPLFHVLAANAHSLRPTDEFYSAHLLWSWLTGADLGEQQRLKLLASTKNVPLLLKDPQALLIQILFCVWPPGVVDRCKFSSIVQILYNLVAVQSLCLVVSYLWPHQRVALFEASRESITSQMLSTVLHILERMQSFYGDVERQPVNIIGDSSQILSGSQSQTAGQTLPVIDEPMTIDDEDEQSSVNWIATLEAMSQLACVPFLRVAALLQHHLYGDECPKFNARLTHNSPHQQIGEEFTRLVRSLSLGYLCESDASNVQESDVALVQMSDCFNWTTSTFVPLVTSWCDEFLQFSSAFPIAARSLLLERPLHWHQPALMRLPYNFNDIFMYYFRKKCSICGLVPKDSAVCLVCGAEVNFRVSCCKDRTERRPTASTHAQHCGTNTAIFLIINTSSIMVIRGMRACIWGSVYLDSHGEEDNGLKRGKPLFLVPERYRLLEQQWLTHSFDHTRGKRWILLQDSG